MLYDEWIRAVNHICTLVRGSEEAKLFTEVM